jgi:hypothetical protein
MGQPYSPPHTEKDYPAWFVEARQQLFAWSALLLCLSSAFAGAVFVRSFYAGSSQLSRVAALSVSWSIAAFPLVGYFGLGAIIFAALAILAAGVVLVQVLRKRIASSDSWTLIVNGLWAVLLYVFSVSWFGVYGD